MFLGKGWSFPPEFRKQHSELTVKMVSEEEDIGESLRILLSTRPGERVMQPSYGCALHNMIFESINESTVTALKDIIDRAVLHFEPRISLENIEIHTDQLLQGELLIQLHYTIRKTNTRSNIVYPFYYREGNQVRV